MFLKAMGEVNIIEIINSILIEQLIKKLLVKINIGQNFDLNIQQISTYKIML